MYKYERIIYWSKDDEAFIVEIPELPGCMADGKTIQEAIQNAEVVIDEWIEVAIERGLLWYNIVVTPRPNRSRI